jgi:predicted AAA+ superfamily ATPase
MAHYRTRHLYRLISKTLQFSPIVGVLGHRQVGKTTLCTTLGKDYLSFDRTEFLDQGIHSPETLLRSHQVFPLVLDECQLAPPLFPALKEWVRTHPKPGQFLLSGSVRFTSRKAIRESLTGRIINWELLPMDLSEAHSSPLPDAIPTLLKSKKFDCPLKAAPYFSQRSYDLALNQGGLPGIFAVRDAAIRRQRFETQMETLLERDLRLLVQTSIEYRTLRNLLALLASQQGLPLDLAGLARASRISVPALRRIVNSLESMFVIRLIETEGSRRRPVIFFEDQGEATYLAGDRPDVLFRMTRFLFSFLRQQWVYRPELEARLFQYRSRGGAFVPLALHTKRGTLGLIPMLDETPGKHEMASARSFLDSYKEGKCLFIHLGQLDRSLGDNLRIVPISVLV